MIPKAEVLATAETADLLPTTVEKDYVLGWVLSAIEDHAEMGQWLFKGGDVPEEVLLRHIPLLGRS